MITVKSNFVDARELHSTLESKKDFSTWMREKIVQADLIEGKDFSPKKGESTGGRPSIDYQLTMDAAKEICLLQQTQKAKELRRYLIKLDDKVTNFELLTTEQVGYMMKIVKCLQYITNQKEAFQLHQSSFIVNSQANNPYAEFALYRNKITGWSKEKIDRAFNEWLLTQCRATSKLTTQSDKLNAMDVNDAIRIAVMDVLYANGSDSELNDKFANAIKRLATEMDVKATRKNEADLYREKESVIPISGIKLIGK
jgi:phage anti-repressor protein